MTPDRVLPRDIRRIIYYVLAVAGVVIGALQTAYGALGQDRPAWLIVATSVLAYLAGGSGVLAVLNTPAGGTYDARHDAEPGA